MAKVEKITINMTAVDLGKVDLLVNEGLYSNRTDFIRTAIRAQMDKHHVELQQSVTRNSYSIGAATFSRNDLEQARDNHQRLKLRVVGMLTLTDDITPELATDVIESIMFRGTFRAPEAVKAALANRMH